MEKITADASHASGQAMGAAAQPQQTHRGRCAVAAAPELATIAHQAEILREDPVAAASPLGLGQPAGWLSCSKRLVCTVVPQSSSRSSRRMACSNSGRR